MQRPLFHYRVSLQRAFFMRDDSDEQMEIIVNEPV